MDFFSSFIFVSMMIYWIWKTKFRVKLYPAVVVNIPLLLAASVCFLIHSSRSELSNNFWRNAAIMFMTYAVVATSLYLWYRITRKWFLAVVCVLSIPLAFKFFLESLNLPDKISVQVIFTIMGLALMIPSVTHCMLNNLKNLTLLVVSSFAFVIALFFRNAPDTISFHLDSSTFLWNFFIIISVFFLLRYLFLLEQVRNRELFLKITAGIKGN